MTQLTEDEDEDGYKIIEDFQDEFPDKFHEILEHFRNNKYKQDMFEKRTQIFAWVFMEIIDYGTLVQF
ncbi:Abi family protein, partial [Escherichia coli]|uniref:Abi family protein n=1 Tax=Escherichia coli TaxID=562 RepID=UPI00202BB442